MNRSFLPKWPLRRKPGTLPADESPFEPQAALPERIIRVAPVALWLLVLMAPFLYSGALAWSAGLLYISYDVLLIFLTIVFTLPLLRPDPPACPRGQDITLAVVIAARNEARVLSTTIAALLNRSDLPDRILIIDDGSSDNTPQVLADHFGLIQRAPGMVSTDHPIVHTVRLHQGGKTRALNAALTLLDEEVVLIVDADTVPRDGAITAVRNAFAAEAHLVATTGLLMPICARTPIGRAMQAFQSYEYMRTALFSYLAMRWNSLLLISGAIAGIRRAAVLEIGGFDSGCLTEDYELIHRLVRHSALHGRSWTTRILGEVQVRTDAPSTLRAFLRQRSRWFGGFLQTQHRYRGMVGDPRFGPLGLWMLPIKAFDTMQPLYGLSAIALFCAFAFQGRVGTLKVASVLISSKIGIDVAFRLWTVFVYRRWTGHTRDASNGWGLASAMIEPFSFTPLRHVGEVWGLLLFLTGRRSSRENGWSNEAWPGPHASVASPEVTLGLRSPSSRCG